MFVSPPLQRRGFFVHQNTRQHVPAFPFFGLISRKPRNLRAVLLFFFFPLLALSQSLPLSLPVKRITTAEGLLQNTVRSIVKDAEGFLWISTSGGLQKFDGYRFYTIPAGNREGQLLSDRQCYLRGDHSGNIWISHNRGLSYFNRKKGRFYNIIHFQVPVVENSLEGMLWVGEDDRQNLWLYHQNDAFYCIDTRKQEICYKGPSIKGLPFSAHEILQLSPQEDGSCVFLVRDSLLHLSLKQNRVVCRLSARNWELPRVLALENNRYFITESATPASWCLVNSTGEILSKGSFPGLPGIFSSIAFNKDYFLCAVYDQLFYVNKFTGTRSATLSTEAHQPLLTTGNVNCMYRDSSGNCWIGSNTEGMLLLQASRQQFRLIRSLTPSDNFIRSLYLDAATAWLWTGSFQNGIVVYDSLGQIVHKISPAALTAGKSSRKGYNAFAVLNTQELLAWGEYEDPVRINRFTGRPIGKLTLEIPDSLKSQYRQYGARFYFDRVVEMQNGDLWLMCRNGILGFHKKPLALELFRVVPGESRYNEALCKGSEDELWWADHNQILHYNIRSGSLARFETGSAAVVKALMPTGNQLYAATDQGLIRFSSEGKKLNQWTTREGLPDNYLYAVLEDRQHRIWCSTNKGLFSLNPDDDRIELFSEEDGLQGKEFNTNAYLRTPAGELFWGGTNGINRINPGYNAATENRQVRITSIMARDSILTDPVYYQLPERFSIPYAIADISILFSTLNFRSDNEYSYRIAGRDTAWLFSGKNNLLRLYLSPGNYQLELKAGKPDALNPITRVPIEILPPWYLSRWAYLSSALLLIGITLSIVYAIYRRRSEKLQREVDTLRKIHQERERISRDLHDNVGAQVTYMLMNLEGLETANPRQVQQVKGVGRSIMDTLRETIWALNEKPVTNLAFADKLKTYISRYIPLQVQYSESLASEEELPKDQVLQLFRIAQEALNNAVKYSGAEKLEIRFHSDAALLMGLSIADNGSGFSLPDVKTGYGLNNMRKRAAEAGIGFHLETAVGKGTRIELELRRNA